METIITSNGSKWAGQEPDTLDVLAERLEKYDLDIKSFAKYGFISFLPDNRVNLFGNFLKVSGVFNIDGDADDTEIKRLMDLIGRNIDRQFN